MKVNKLLAIALGMGMAASAMAAGNTAVVSVSATVVGVCKFVSATGTVAFTLDPSVGGSVNGTVSQPTFWCTNGATYAISDDNGVNKTGTTYRMKDSAGNYIPYSFGYTNSGTGSGKSTTITMDIAATVAAADYLNAVAGNTYADTVTLTIAP